MTFTTNTDDYVQSASRLRRMGDTDSCSLDTTLDFNGVVAVVHISPRALMLIMQGCFRSFKSAYLACFSFQGSKTP